MIRAVIDTNILIRALIKPAGTVGPIVLRLARGDFTLVYSRALLEELIEKITLPRIRDKYDLTDDRLSTFFNLIVAEGELVEPVRRIAICRDPDDDKVIEAALAGDALYVVTGDDDLLTLEQFESVQFITPREFLGKMELPL